MPKVIQVIESEVSRGAGTEEDRCRTVTQYHTPEGDFLAERDPCLRELRDFWTKGDYFRRAGVNVVHATTATADGIFDGERMVPMAEYNARN